MTHTRGSGAIADAFISAGEIGSRQIEIEVTKAAQERKALKDATAGGTTPASGAPVPTKP